MTSPRMVRLIIYRQQYYKYNFQASEATTKNPLVLPKVIVTNALTGVKKILTLILIDIILSTSFQRLI
jgi:hypothetical protein